jgi:DNA-binding transcriptional MerR regulator
VVATRAQRSPDEISIRVLSRRTSIEPDTLRMWERRYGFPRPTRTPGGSRRYTEADVLTLASIRRAMQAGYRPGEVVGKSREEIDRLISASTRSSEFAAPSVDFILSVLCEDDLVTVRDAIRDAALLLGPRKFVVELAQPLLVAVGERWAQGRLEVRHEHALSEVLSSQLRIMISTFDDRAQRPSVLLATLSGEAHGLPLELLSLYLAVNRVSPRLLGVDTPREEILRAAIAYDVDAIALWTRRSVDMKPVTRAVRWLLGELPRRVSLWLGGPGASAIEAPSLTAVETFADLDRAIEGLLRDR